MSTEDEALGRRAAVTKKRLDALVSLGDTQIDGALIKMRWLAAGGTDTVTVDCPAAFVPRVGTVVGLGTTHPELVVSHQEWVPWLSWGDHQRRVVDQALVAYRLAVVSPGTATAP